MQGFGAPLSVYLFYLLKSVVYIVGWLGWCHLNPHLGAWSEVHTWWSHPSAFQTAIIWSMLFEVVGLGCGSGPLTARYLPPLGGALYFLRIGTMKRAVWPSLPLVGGDTRGILDVGLYLALIAALSWSLISPGSSPAQLLWIITLIPLLGVMDQLIFLSARAEHYWVMLLGCWWAGDHVEIWLAGAMCVQLALWFWAGISKLNAHFPTVISVMLSNHPLNRSTRLRRALYRDFPRDLHPSRLAKLLAHLGALSELGAPLLLGAVYLGVGGESAQHMLWIAGLIVAVQLHLFIMSNVPMGVPIEWNICILYTVFALFGAHPDLNPLTTLWSARAEYPIYLVSLIICLITVPLLGNLVPRRVSFLLSMRYYAGNWPYSVWLFKGDAHERLKALKMTSPWITDQLGVLYDERVVEGVIGRVLGFRLMHLQGRALNALIPRAIDAPLSEYRYMEGEVVGGLILGWNFGDGHLHQDGLLRQVQARCRFEPGELRCIFVESQPLGGSEMRYELHDAASGLLQRGATEISALLAAQPWEAPEIIERDEVSVSK